MIPRAGARGLDELLEDAVKTAGYENKMEIKDLLELLVELM